MWHSPSIRAGREDTLMRPAGQLPSPRSDPPNEPSSTRPTEPRRHPLAPTSFLAINSFGANLPWLLVHRHKNCFWKGPWPWVSYFLYFSHGITSRGATVHTHTQGHTLIVPHWLCAVSQKPGSPRVQQAQLTDLQMHISWLLIPYSLEFAALQSNSFDGIQPLRKGF